MKVQDRSALVAGGASGIGEALVRKLVECECKVVVADYDLAAAQSLADELGDSVYAVQFDAADTASIEQMAEKAWQQLGGVDLVFANAGVSAGAPLLEATVEQFDWQFNVNVRGVWATTKAFANRMIADNRPGHIVMTGSEHSLGVQHAGIGVYTGTKHAVLGIADILRSELPDNVAVSVLCPGIVATKLYDADRYGVVDKAPEEMKVLGSMVMSKGKSAAEIADRTMAGIEAGDFLIVTHPNSFAAAEKRFEEIKQAFEGQAPYTAESKQYEMDAIVAQVMEEISGKQD